MKEFDVLDLEDRQVELVMFLCDVCNHNEVFVEDVDDARMLRMIVNYGIEAFIDHLNCWDVDVPPVYPEVGSRQWE